MRSFLSSLLRYSLCVATLSGASHAYASFPNTSEPTTFLGPNLKARYTSTFNDTTAYSLALEGGYKNARGAATFGWQIDEDQRAKITLEYLWQQLAYGFASGNTSQWVSQGALGAAYQFDLALNYYPQIGLSAYVSYAPNKSLGTMTGTFTNNLGVTQTYVNPRKIAGSTAGGVAPSVTISPYLGTKASIELNYDSVKYDKSYAPFTEANGFGGTGKLSQALSPDVTVNFLASVRKPFNNYQAGITWANLPFVERWLIGVDAAYTAGKYSLPNSWIASLSGSYDLDHDGGMPMSEFNLREHDMKGEITNIPHDSLASWTADPAVYMPQVLAIPDQQVLRGCKYGVVTFVGNIPAQSTAGGSATVTVNAANYFTGGANLVYSMTASAVPFAGNTLTLNPATGVLTATGASRQTITVTITATNPCGSAVSNAFVITY